MREYRNPVGEFDANTAIWPYLPGIDTQMETVRANSEFYGGPNQGLLMHDVGPKVWKKDRGFHFFFLHPVVASAEAWVIIRPSSCAELVFPWGISPALDVIILLLVNKSLLTQ